MTGFDFLDTLGIKRYINFYVLYCIMLMSLEFHGYYNWFLRMPGYDVLDTLCIKRYMNLI